MFARGSLQLGGKETEAFIMAAATVDGGEGALATSGAGIGLAYKDTDILNNIINCIVYLSIVIISMCHFYWSS